MLIGYCINQDDLDERRQQVQQMGTVYSTARQVLFYIGRLTELTDFLFASIEEFLARWPHKTNGWTDPTFSPSDVVDPAMWHDFASVPEEGH